MNNFIKFAAVGLAGYFIGFYEMKYKTMEAVLQVELDKDKKDNDKEENKEES